MNVRENGRAIKNGQPRDSGSIGHTRRRQKRQNSTTQHRTLNRWATQTPLKQGVKPGSPGG